MLASLIFASILLLLIYLCKYLLFLIPVLAQLFVPGVPIPVVADVLATIYVLLSLLLLPNPAVADVLAELAPWFDSTAISDVACLWCPICYWFLVSLPSLVTGIPCHCWLLGPSCCWLVASLLLLVSLPLLVSLMHQASHLLLLS